MKQNYSINDVANIYSLPKSTLTFWEKKELIQPRRNSENNYRMYGIKDVVEVGDIALYRKMSVSISSLKNYDKMSYDEVHTMIKQTKNEVETNISELKQAEKALSTRLDKMSLIQQLESVSFLDGNPDFNALGAFVFDDPKFVERFQKNPHGFALLIDVFPEVKIQEAFFHEMGSLDSPPLWIKNKENKYRSKLLKIATDDLTINNLFDLLEDCSKKEIKNTIVANYLSTFVTDRRYDFYQAWFESDK